MADVGRLAVKLVADTSGLSMGLDSAKNRVKDFEARTKSLQGSMSNLGEVSQQLKSKIGALAGAFGTAAFVGKLVETQRQFDVLNASMITMTGSSAAAEREFRWLKEFAATTPFALNEVVGAFVRMSSLGLDPSREALESYGNTASAMGKSLNQMIEAVADAATGEFERLKEFGIKASKEGDNVSLTFQGITTTVRNSAEEITGYLDKIGRNQFAGAMAERAKTLDGAISNLGDSWDELFRTINNANAGGLIYDSVKLATGAIEQATKIIDAMSSAANNNSTQTGAMAATLNGITTVFETVAVVGANVAFVLKSTGRELGGLAAQAAAVARFDFSGAKTIGQLMKSDAIAARDEVDRLTAAILGARSAAVGNEPKQDNRTVAPAIAIDTPSKTGRKTGGDIDKDAEDAMKKAQEVEAFFANVDDEARQRDVNGLRTFVEGLRQREELRLQSMLNEQQLAEQAYQKEYEQLIKAKETFGLTEEEYTERLLQIRMDRDERLMNADLAMLAHEQQVADERVRINQQAEQAITYAKSQATQAAINLLSALGGKSKVAAIAAIALGKAVAIADIIRHTAVAQMHAMAQLGPIAGPAAAAKIGMMGKVQAGLVAATGLVQAANVGGGNGAAASVATSAQSSGSTQSAAAGGAGMAQTITIQGVNNGDLFSGDAVRTLIDRLIDAQRNGARIVLA
jgi:hypothetical protein